MEQPYWIEPGIGDGMGTVNGAEPVPTDHHNVRPILSFLTPYPTTPIKIGDYVADNLDEYHSGKKLNKVFNSKKIGGPGKLQETWKKLKKYYLQYGGDDAEYICDIMIKVYLRQTFTEYAQTRKAASYGYFQMLYTTAILAGRQGPNYPRRPGNYPAPEKMADEDIFTPYILKFIKDNVKRTLGVNKSFDSNNWKDGFEQGWLDSYYIYNQRPGYNSEVLSNSTYFLPR
jgi:hypothetical protein